MIEDMNEVSAALKRMQEEQARLDGTFNTVDAPIEAKAEVELPEVKAAEHVENVSKAVSEVVENLPDTSPLQVPAPETQFGAAMEQVKLNVLAEASAEDEQFVDKVKSTLSKRLQSSTQKLKKNVQTSKSKRSILRVKYFKPNNKRMSIVPSKINGRTENANDNITITASNLSCASSALKSRSISSCSICLRLC